MRSMILYPEMATVIPRSGHHYLSHQGLRRLNSGSCKGLRLHGLQDQLQLRSFSASAPQWGTSSAAIKLKDSALFREQAYVDGQWIGAKSNSIFEVFDPWTNDVIGKCPEMTTEDVNNAIEVAQRSFQSFQHTAPKARAKILRNWFNLMVEHQESLAKILMYENGRPIQGARQEIAYAASFFDWFAGEAERSYGYTAYGSTPGNRVITIQQPVGVVGVLTPWNFPSAMITRKVGGAIAAGCSIVLKPAAETPYSALALAELGERAGVPKGVFNVVTTDKHVQDVGSAITTHTDVKKISFTGSTRVGKLLMAQASSTMKKCSFELGGNAPFIGRSGNSATVAQRFENADRAQSSMMQILQKSCQGCLRASSVALVRLASLLIASTSSPVSTTTSWRNLQNRSRLKSEKAI